MGGLPPKMEELPLPRRPPPADRALEIWEIWRDWGTCWGRSTQSLLPLVGELSGGSGGDERTALLYALRPFLKPERRDKVERAVKAARLIHVGKKFLTSLGDGHV